MITKKYNYPKNPKTLLNKEEIRDYLFYLREKNSLTKLEIPFFAYYIVADCLLNDVKNGGFHKFLVSPNVVTMPYLEHCARLMKLDELGDIINELMSKVDVRFNVFDILSRKALDFNDEFLSVLSKLDNRLFALDKKCNIKKTAREYYQSNIPSGKFEIQIANPTESENQQTTQENPKEDSPLDEDVPLSEVVLNYRCYNHNSDFYLVDMTLNLDSDKISWEKMSVPEEGVSPINWQTPYLEQYLSLDGKVKVCNLYELPSPSVKPNHVVFFIYKHGGKILRTPYGDFPLTDEEETPKHLKTIVEFADID